MLINSIKQCLKLLSVKKKHIPIRITSLSATLTSVNFYVSDVSKRETLF